MSVGDAMSQTAIDLSLEHVTIKPLLNLKWSTASLWWINVFRTSPVFTSQTLQQKVILSQLKDDGIEHKQAHLLKGYLLAYVKWKIAKYLKGVLTSS